MKLEAKKNVWDLNGDGKNKRAYMQMGLNFGLYRTLVKSDIFDPAKSTGEQREIVKNRVNKLRKAIVSNKYTPTTFNAVINKQKVEMNGKNAIIYVEPTDQLSLLDGGQRTEALNQLRAESPKMARLIDNLPVPLLIYLDPEHRQADFINLQDRLPVNGSHMTALKVLGQDFDAKLLPLMELARDIALAMYGDALNPFYKKIKFSSSSGAPIELKSILSAGASDLSYSLVGAAKILEKSGKTAKWYSDLMTELYTAVLEEGPDALNLGKLLCLPPEGKKGSVSSWINITNVIAYRLFLRNQDDLTEADKEIALDAISDVYDEKIEGDYSTVRKRTLAGNFTVAAFHDMADDEDCEFGFHFGCVLPLVLLWGSSCLNIERLAPIGSKKKDRKPKKTKSVELSSENDEIDDIANIINESDTDLEFLN